MKISHLNAKKVPALSLVLVAVAGMVAGVLAAIVVNTGSFDFTGEGGTFHQDLGTMTISDNGLSILSSATGITSNSTGIFGGSGNNKNIYTGAAFTAGHWIETLVFTDTTADNSAHTVKITISSGSGPTGTSLVAVPTLTLTGGGSSGGTITVIIDLGTSNITSPMTVYVSST